MTSIDQIKQVAVPVLKSHGATRAGLFGSAARGEMAPDSDIDMLVELPSHLSLLDFIGIKMELEEKLGRAVDLVEYDALKSILRPTVLKEQLPLL